MTENDWNEVEADLKGRLEAKAPCPAVVSIFEMERRIEAAVEAERERCAQIAEEFVGGGMIALEIRARGKA